MKIVNHNCIYAFKKLGKVVLFKLVKLNCYLCQHS